jgi:hypothetical protein
MEGFGGKGGKYMNKYGVLYTMALPLILYQQLILYDKLVITRGIFLKIYFNVDHHVVLKEKLS